MHDSSKTRDKKFVTDLYFSMNKVARQSGLSSASSLYRYVDGKAELWDLICARDFELFGKALQNAVKNNPNPADAVKEMRRFFIDFAIDDFARLERMFLTPPPPDLTEHEIIQEELEEDTSDMTLDILANSVQDALQSQGIDQDQVFVAHYLWVLVLGSSILMYPSSHGISAPYLSTPEQAEKFKDFVLDKSSSLYTTDEP